MGAITTALLQEPAPALGFAASRRDSPIAPIVSPLSIWLDESEGGAPIVEGRWLGVET